MTVTLQRQSSWEDEKGNSESVFSLLSTLTFPLLNLISFQNEKVLGTPPSVQIMRPRQWVS